MQKLKVQGFILIDTNVAALNNTGKDTKTNNANGISTKTIYKSGRTHVYAAGQAFGYWWRETLHNDFGWELSPLERAENGVVFTAANPFKYPDDDIFGYMRAAKQDKIGEDGFAVKNTKGGAKQEDVTVTRKGPLSKSGMFSVLPVSKAKQFSVMGRQNGFASPYVKDEYSAILKAQFCLDTAAVGTFTSINRSGFKNLSTNLLTSYDAFDAIELDHPYYKDANGEPSKIIRLPLDKRIQRSIETILALKTLSGGAMQSNNMEDVAPKFIILTSMTSGSHPFGNIVGERSRQIESVEIIEEVEESEDTSASYKPFNDSFSLNVNAIAEVLKDHTEYILDTVFIGMRLGFLDEFREQVKTLENLGEAYPKVKVLSIGDAIDGYCKQLTVQMQ